MWLVLQGNYPGTNQSAIHSNYNKLYMSGSIHFLILSDGLLLYCKSVTDEIVTFCNVVGIYRLKNKGSGKSDFDGN